MGGSGGRGGGGSGGSSEGSSGGGGEGGSGDVGLNQPGTLLFKCSSRVHYINHVFHPQGNLMAWEPGNQGWTLCGEQYPGRLASFVPGVRVAWKPVKMAMRIDEEGHLHGSVYRRGIGGGCGEMRGLAVGG